MFGCVAMATIEMAGTAGITAGFADILGYLVQIDCTYYLAGSRWKLHFFIHRMAGQAGWFSVSARGVMAGQAIDIFFGGEIEIPVLKAIAHMAGSAISLIAGNADTEIIDQRLFTDRLAGIRIKRFQGPVLGFHHLTSRFGMAAQAGPGNFRARFEILLQYFKLFVISGAACYGMSHIKNHRKTQANSEKTEFH